MDGAANYRLQDFVPVIYCVSFLFCVQKAQKRRIWFIKAAP